jgi:glycine cleavage system aminomethyltransferase T
MSFEFLAPDQAQTRNGTEPPARSPIEWAHLEAGAQLGGLAGWSVVNDYGAIGPETAACRESVGVADGCFIGKLELQSDSGTVASIVARLAGGAVLEPGRATRHDETWWCPVTAGKVLALTQPERTPAVRERLEAAAAEAPFASVTELTAALGSNVIAGPLAREAFARTTALDLRPDRFPEAAFAPVSVARTPGMVLRERGDRYLHVFGAGYAQYNWTVFVDAAESLGGRAVGLEALAAAEASGVAADA